MRQRSHLFEQLKTTEKIKVNPAHGMDCQRELSARLEMVKAADAAWKAAFEGADPLRKAGMKNDML